MAKVSVVVPIYNVENYLEKCIDSILVQDEKNIEIILVDDGSTDNCPAICDAYAEKDSRIQVIHKKNGGLGDARNAGINAVTSKYILFVDSDDYIALNTVSTLLERAEKFDADIVLFNTVSVRENGEQVDLYTMHLPAEQKLYPSECKAILTVTPTAWSKLYKKSLFDDETVRFTPRDWYEDLRFNTKLYPKCTCVVYADCEPLYFYLIRDNSIMRSGNIEKNKTQRMEAVNEIFAYYKENGLYEEYREELEWIWMLHGYFLPAREILHYDGAWASAIKELKVYMKKNLPSPFKNKYFRILSKKEQIIFRCFYYGLHPLMRLVLKLRG